MSFIILDRDGVINFDSEEYIKSPEEWRAIPGSLEAIARLNQAGFSVCVATNQSGIARGYYDLSILNKIHHKLVQELSLVGGKIHEFFFCPHHPDENCNCRKPKPGLLHKIRDKYALNLTEIYFIGDSIVDIKAAEEAGCKPLLVLTGKGNATLENFPDLTVPSFQNLASAVTFILSAKK